MSGDWGNLVIPYLARIFLMKCYGMLPNARSTAFTVYELFRANQQGNFIPLPLPHAHTHTSRLRLRQTLMLEFPVKSGSTLVSRILIMQ